SQRLAPIEHLLGAGAERPAVRHLVILPSPALAGIPIETLTGDYTISYAPSGTIFAWLQETCRDRGSQNSPAQPPRLLVLGDPALPPPDSLAVAAPQPPDHGVLVQNVTPRSNAARGGIQPGDVVLRYADIRLSGVADLGSALKTHSGGKARLALQVWR